MYGLILTYLLIQHLPQAIRSDGTFGPITTGSISEIGGTGIFENLVMNVGNGSDCASQERRKMHTISIVM